MARETWLWQHETPQHEPHAIKPTLTVSVGHSFRSSTMHDRCKRCNGRHEGTCTVCNLPIYRVDTNEGPEGLKALLRF